ncbi:cubilin-like [Ornithodoros turicata]|uniref:cubilin-like n=1 Tax=Ornithodoros turicata TaxID=34597 RepID=UPI0031399CD1
MGLQAALFTLAVTLIALAPCCVAKHKSPNCPTELNLNATENLKSFTCSFKETSYNLSVKVDAGKEAGIFLKFTSIQLFEGDNFYLLRDASDKSTAFLHTQGPHEEFSYYVAAEEVTVLVEGSERGKQDRVLKGVVHTGCQENITDEVEMYKLFSYNNQSVTTKCTIRIHPQSKGTHVATATVRNVSLSGKSSLESDGLAINYNSKTMAAAPFELIHEEITLILQLDQSITDQSFTLLLGRVNKACSGMYKVEDKQNLTLTAGDEKLYLSDVDCRWVLEGQKDKVLGVTVSEFALQHAQDSFVVTDGGSRDSPPLMQAFQADSERAKGLLIRSSGQYLWISLTLAEFVGKDKFDAMVNVYGGGKRLFKNGAVSINSDGVAYFLEVDPGQQVLLEQPSFSLKPSSHVLIYSDFSRNSPLLEDLKESSPKRPIVSTGNRMLLLSSGFQKSDSFKANFTTANPGCHSVTLGRHGFYTLSGNCNTSCSWVVRPPSAENNGKLLVTFSHLNFGAGGTLSLSTLDMKPLLKANCSSSTVPPIEVNASDGLYLSVNRGTCSGSDANSTGLSATVTSVPSETATPELEPHVGYALRSPRYPNQYPLNSNQSWSFKTSGLGGFHLTFNSFDLKPGHFLNLSNGAINVPLYGSTLPKDLLVGPQLNALFSSPSSGRKESGYGFDAVLTPCDEFHDVVNKSGFVETPSYPAPVKKNSLYYWSITVPDPNNNTATAVRFNISYNLTSPPPNISDFLIIYDGDSVRSPRISNFTSDLLISRTRSLLVKYESSKNEASGTPVRISFEAYYCNKSDTCHNTGYCIHEDWRCNGVNDCGDNTDELYCGGVPPPQPPPAPTTPAPGPPSEHTSGGVSPAAFAVSIIIALILGIAGTLVAPVLVRRYRAYRYSRFSSVSVTE